MKKNTITYLFTRILQIAAMIATLRVMTHQLIPTELGKYNLIMIIVGLFSLLLIYPVGVYINRQQHAWQKSGVARKRIMTCIVYFLLATLFSAIIIKLFFQPIANLYNLNNNWLLIAVTSSLTFTSINCTLLSYLNLQGRFVSWSIITHITLWLGLFAAYWLTTINANALYWFIGILLGQILGMLAAIVPFLKLSKSTNTTTSDSYQPVAMRSALTFILPVSMVVGLGWAQYQSYRMVIAHIESLHYLGLFVAGYAISSGIFQAFETTIQQYTNPTFYKNISEKSKSDIESVWKSYYQTIIPMIIIAMSFLIILSNPLLHLLVDEKYWNATQFVILGAIVEALRVTGNVYVLAAHAIKNTKTLIAPQLSGALIVIIFVPISLYFKKPQLLSIALIIAGFAYVICLHMTIRKLFDTQITLKNIKLVLAACGAFYLLHYLMQLVDLKQLQNLTILGLTGLVYLIVNYLIVRKTIWFNRPSMQ